mmetsp:Transcript_16232/g.27877  ORF Transcript_16232/g.27877 Transcript_16232/m.27877 type:complete len:104 (-) Transcript_16232:767-1078(-)
MLEKDWKREKRRRLLYRAAWQGFLICMLLYAHAPASWDVVFRPGWTSAAGTQQVRHWTKSGGVQDQRMADVLSVWIPAGCDRLRYLSHPHYTGKVCLPKLGVV